MTLLQECSAGYWPGAILHPVSYGKLSVELNVERNSGSYSYRDLCVTKVIRGGPGCHLTQRGAKGLSPR